MLSLTGAGGAGKSRLALRLASELIEQHSDGVWHVDISALAHPTLVPHAVASALGVRERPGRQLMEALTAEVRSAKLLLVLDNCEHLAAACGTLAAALLQAGPGLRILATSRQALGAPGEATWPVPALSVPGPGEASTVEALLEYEAPRLFVERAMAARPTLSPSLRDVVTVAEICRQLEGIPLAIELAAARVKVLTVEQIAARLGDRFLLLKGRSVDPARHQTLYALVEWSHELLSEAEQVLFRRLSVFAGGWSLEAAEAVCSSEQLSADAILPNMAQLVAKSLVLAEEQHGEMRYAMLEMICQHAADKLRESAEEEVVRGRHRDWLLGLADQAEEAVWGPAQVEWLDRLERDLDNIRSMLHWAIERGEIESGLRLAGALWRFWQVRGHVGEGEQWLEQLLALAGHEMRTAGRAKALKAAGFLLFLQGDYPAAERLIEESLAIGRELSDRLGIVASLCDLGLVRRCAGDFVSARALLEEALARSRELGSRTWEARTLNNLARMSFYEGDLATSRALHEKSLAKGREVGDSWAMAIALGDLGDVAQAQGEESSARSFHKESLALWQRVGDGRGIAQSLEGLAILAAARSDTERAVRLLGAAAALREVISELPSLSRRKILDELLLTARETLGDGAYCVVFAEGETMPLEQAIDLALSAGDVPRRRRRQPEASSLIRETQPLTERECEVATRVARGLTNREIAAELVISELTAETHVRNILRKLDFTTRAQIAAWAVEHGLDD